MKEQPVAPSAQKAEEVDLADAFAVASSTLLVKAETSAFDLEGLIHVSLRRRERKDVPLFAR